MTLHLRLAALGIAAILTLGGCVAGQSREATMRKYGIVIHGGAGTILRQEMSPELEKEYHAALTVARDAGYAVLARGGGALDAVQAAVIELENSPLFNAGKGAVLNSAGDCEMDASIMDGKTHAAGAVAAVRRIRNPILASRAVMEKTGHVILAAEGAEHFAAAQKLELVDNSHFKTERRIKQWQKARELEERKKSAKDQHERVSDGDLSGEPDSRMGTVGAVALDQAGNLAAATSTGGRSMKAPGRIGDSPIPGAGTWADNRTCAVSGTGFGEKFILTTATRDVAALMEYKGMSVQESAAAVIQKIESLGGDGGLIAIDHQGNIALPFDTPGMYRAWRLSDGKGETAIFK